MKFSYKVAPNYAAKQSTTGIMLELSLALVVVTVASAIWYGMTGGAELGIRVMNEEEFVELLRELGEIQ